MKFKYNTKLALIKLRLEKLVYKIRSFKLVKINDTHRKNIPGWLIKTIFLFILVISVLISWQFINGQAQARTVMLDKNDYLSGTSDFGTIKLGADSMSIGLQKGNVGQWNNSTNTGIQSLQTNNYGISNMIYGPNNTLYIMTSFATSCFFKRYDIETKTYTTLNMPPISCGTGSVLKFDSSGSLYYIPGGTVAIPLDRFFRYDLADDSWHELARLPTTVSNYSSGVMVSQGSAKYLYVFRGMSSASFWRYSVDTNTWENMPPSPTSSATYGIVTAWDGANTIYTIGNHTGEFRKYDILNKTWTNLTTIAGSGYNFHSLQYINGTILAMRLNWSSNAPTLRSYNISSGIWTDLAIPPSPANYYDNTLPIAYDGSRYIYTMIASDFRPDLYRYDTVNKTWNGTSIIMPLDTTGSANNLIYDGLQSVYYFGGTLGSYYGSYSDRVYKYDISTKTTTKLAALINSYYGWDGVYYSGVANGNVPALYVIGTSGRINFGRYNLGTNDITPLTDLPLTVSIAGTDIINGDDGYLYMSFGGGRTNFQRYNIATNVWEALTSMPLATNGGSNMARIGNNIYILVGNQSAKVVVYDMILKTWSTIITPSGDIDYGGFITSDQSRYLYIGVNNRTNSTGRIVYKYDTTTSSWQRIADTPAVTKPYANSFYDPISEKLYVTQGQIEASIWDWSSNTAEYVTSGTWYSKVYDLNQVDSWQPLQYTKSGTGTVTIYTRSSSNNNIWSDWQQVNSGLIASPFNRYLQLKVTLTGDGTSTPIISDISINHLQETAAPNPPAQFFASGKKDGAALVSGADHEYQHPYFSWSPADDGGGSGVAGYYVYFGTDSSADPAVDGNFQVETNYTVSMPMSSGAVYYLRMKVKDRLSNTTSATTYFSYRYSYISPPGTVVKTSDGDFSEGINTSVNISNGTIKLTQSLDGAWSTGPLSMPPENTQGGTQTVVGDYIYVARGSSTNVFWRYNLVTQSWDTLNNIPSNVTSGSSMAYDGNNYIYLMAGGNTTNFYRYNLTTGIWFVMSPLPAGAQAGSDIVYVGNNRFAIMFTGIREFYIYNATTNISFPATTYPGVISESGSGLWYDGKDNIYAYLGSYDWGSAGTTRNNMVKYSLSTGDWKVLANPPVMSNYTQNNLVSDGQGGLYVLNHNQSDNMDKKQRMMRYDIAQDSWQEVAGLEDQVYTGSASSDGKRYIYILPGGNGTNSRKIIRYDTWNKDFTPKEKGVDVWQKIPYDSHINGWQWVGGQASTAIYDGSKYIYALAGNESTNSWVRFMKYDHKTGETIYLPSPPTIGIGGALSYLNGQIFYLSAKSTKEFYKFEEVTSQWIKMADLPVVAYRPGPSTLVAVGNYLYALMGNGKLFYKYTPDSNMGMWSPALAAPATSILNGSAVYDAVNNAIFVISGNGSTAFYRYDIATNAWTTKTKLPVATSYGSTMTISNGMIYCQIGNSTKASYIYDINNNTWRDGVAATELFRYGSIALAVSNQYAMYFAGEASPDVWQFNYPSDNSAYKGLAVHISQPIVVAGLYDYAGISAQVTLPDNTNIELWTRSSPDNINWDEWVISKNIKKYTNSVNGSIMSKPQKYTQVKIILESDDNLYSPSVDSYAVSYYFDIDPPKNPVTMKVYSDNTKSTEVSNNTWYTNSKPVFDWPDPGQPGGATDGEVGSRIAGYWVYVGTDPTASPRTAGKFITSTEFEADLLESGNYHVLIQAQDMTGNTDGDIYDPFVYRFDNQPPANPSIISSTPSGFTAKNNFSFEWPNSFDGQSGIAGYCYHTGANSGPFAAEICQTETSLTNIPAAYQAGTNILYVRAYDVAGNYSSSYTTISYYYSTDPPGPVTNLYASPSSSTDNIFRFVWSLPVLFAGNPESLVYCYSINVLPSPLNTTCQPQITSTSSFKAATQQGINIIYMVAKDEAGNVNWNNFASANFIANTISPGIPLNLSVTDTSDRISNRWALTATWDVPTFKGNGISQYIIERSDDGHTFYQVGTTSTRAFVDLEITPESTYYYRIFAADNVDNRGGASAVVSRIAQGNFSTPPQVVVQPNVKVGFDQADINWATSRESTSFVYYGLAPSALGQSKGSLDLLTNHNQSLSGLQPSTIYYYRIQSFDNARSYSLNEAFSPIYSFRTTEEAQVFDVSIDEITSSTAIISWKTSAPTMARLDYGPSLSYGISVDDNNITASTIHIVKLSSLDSGKAYHIKIVSTTEYGSKLNSDDYTFQTIERPKVSEVRFQPVDSEAMAGVKITWKTNVPTSSTVQYEALGARLESSLSDLVTLHEINLQNLASNTEYSISVYGRDQYGNLAPSSTQVWQSQLDTRPPAISNLSYGVNIIESTKGKRAQIIVTWNTDEPATSQLAFGPMSNSNLLNKTTLSAEPTTSHVAIISDLNLADIYKVQASSRDLNGNVAYGATTTVVTPDKEVGIFDSILNLMLKLFSF